MAIKRQSLRFGIKLGGALLLLAACYASGLLLFHWAQKDKNGNRPRDVAKAFIEAVQSNDFAKAASFWKPGAVQNAESNFRMKFEEFCVQTFKCDTYKLSRTRRDKESCYTLRFAGVRDGHQTAWGLYFERVDGEWRIVEDLWFSGADLKQWEADK